MKDFLPGGVLRAKEKTVGGENAATLAGKVDFERIKES